MADPITRSAGGLDLSDRVVQSNTVAGSPATNAITSVCSVTWNPPDNPAAVTGALLDGFAAFTVGTSGVTATLAIRRGSTAGTVIASTGALTVVAATLVSFSVQGIDAVAFVPGQVWVLCLTIGSGAAVSTVSATQLVAFIV